MTEESCTESLTIKKNTSRNSRYSSNQEIFQATAEETAKKVRQKEMKNIFCGFCGCCGFMERNGNL